MLAPSCLAQPLLPLAALGSQGSGSSWHIWGSVCRPERECPHPPGLHSLASHEEDAFFWKVSLLCSTWQVYTLWLSQSLSVMVSTL